MKGRHTRKVVYVATARDDAREFMKAYRFSAIVEKDGTLCLTGLPPDKEVEVVVMEQAGLPPEIQDWLADIRTRHPFAKMTKEQILEALRQTRAAVS
jgi:hypothetical protein